MNFQTSSPAGEPDEEIFLSGLDTHVAAKRLALAMTVWIFYDLLITTSDNAAYYLPQRWTPGRILFLLNRVFVPFIVLLDTISLMLAQPPTWLCSLYPWLLLMGNWLVIVCIAAALIARVHALWQRRWLLIAMVAFFILTSSGTIVFVFFIAAKSPGRPTSFPPPFTGCIWFPRSRYFWVSFLTPGIFETLCVVLTFWKTWKAERKGGAPTMYILFHDGLFHYTCIISLKLFSVVSVFFPLTRPFLISNAVLPVTSIICSRIYTRLHGLVRRVQEPMYRQNRLPVATFATCSRTNLISEGMMSAREFSVGEDMTHYWTYEKPLPPLPISRTFSISSRIAPTIRFTSSKCI